ncbi:MAG: hypothetical protein Aurels2KO_55230 [Aureliella sp.]
MAHILIQYVQTVWTKSSRGGDAARVRNAVPDALALPSTIRDAPFVLHHARFVERDNFIQTDRFCSGTCFSDLSLDDLKLILAPDSVTVRFRRNGNNTARTIPHPFTDVFTLAESQWGRLTYNGRFTAWNTGNWWYEKSVVNIGWFANIDFQQFVKTAPTYDFAEMAHLR